MAFLDKNSVFVPVCSLPFRWWNEAAQHSVGSFCITFWPSGKYPEIGERNVSSIMILHYSSSCIYLFPTFIFYLIVPPLQRHWFTTILKEKICAHMNNPPMIESNPYFSNAKEKMISWLITERAQLLEWKNKLLSRSIPRVILTRVKEKSPLTHPHNSQFTTCIIQAVNCSIASVLNIEMRKRKMNEMRPSSLQLHNIIQLGFLFPFPIHNVSLL